MVVVVVVVAGVALPTVAMVVVAGDVGTEERLAVLASRGKATRGTVPPHGVAVVGQMLRVFGGRVATGYCVRLLERPIHTTAAAAALALVTAEVSGAAEREKAPKTLATRKRVRPIPVEVGAVLGGLARTAQVKAAADLRR
jgi:hypothetical protein